MILASSDDFTRSFSWFIAYLSLCFMNFKLIDTIEIELRRPKEDFFFLSYATLIVKKNASPFGLYKWFDPQPRSPLALEATDATRSPHLSALSTSRSLQRLPKKQKLYSCLGV